MRIEPLWTLFQDDDRQLEFNLAIMHELNLRRPVLVPVLLLREELWTWPGRKSDENQQRPANVTGRRHATRRNRARDMDDFTRFEDMLRHFPVEISTFLENQIHRCLVYIGDTDSFWRQLKKVILDEEEEDIEMQTLAVVSQ
ncbi:hypothetical protein ElyMa_005292800 [Elysia marginata]|uniref:Uncharacterized protein n=1 Tax=Elysia marginata TaxID=1093978 RepID=A0AAV4K083_9GAST|nr:hypothetical protein ElyMa_005292800 [Elysia marginata]